MFAAIRRAVVVLGLPVLSLAMAGCHATPKPSTHFEADGTHGSVAVIENDSVILDLPSVDIRSGVTTITGTIHRKPGVTGELPGRVDIEFLDADGQYLDGLPVLLQPRAVPVDPKSSASYVTHYGYVPPVGATVRVHFIDRDKQIEEDAEGDDFSYGAAAGKGEGGKGGSRMTNSNPGHETSAAHSNNIGSGGFGTGTHW